jgi:hypothetical protein
MRQAQIEHSAVGKAGRARGNDAPVGSAVPGFEHADVGADEYPICVERIDGNCVGRNVTEPAVGERDADIGPFRRAMPMRRDHALPDMRVAEAAHDDDDRVVLTGKRAQVRNVPGRVVVDVPLRQRRRADERRGPVLGEGELVDLAGVRRRVDQVGVDITQRGDELSRHEPRERHLRCPRPLLSTNQDARPFRRVDVDDGCPERYRLDIRAAGGHRRIE